MAKDVVKNKRKKVVKGKHAKSKQGAKPGRITEPTDKCELGPITLPIWYRFCKTCRVFHLIKEALPPKMEPEAIDYSKPLKNNKYERFCQEFIVDNNGAQAAIRAGYSSKNANDKGAQLSAIISIKNRIAVLQADLSDASGVDAQMLMDELKKIGFSNIDDYIRIDAGGNVIGVDFDLINISKLAAIESIKQTVNITSNKDGKKEYETRNFTFKLHDKIKAIVEMAKHIGFYEKDNSQKKESLAEFLKAMKDG